ncbi:MAG: YitT family protein [Firmicutes bacterium]|nr:YitT family protein [Bacillota bacterium]
MFEYGMVTLGAALTALAYNWFLIPNRIAAGGAGGLGTILHYLWNFPVGVTILLFNIPLFIAVTKIMGTRFGIKSIYGALLLGVFTDIFALFTQGITTDPLLSAIYGGSMMGVGIGLAMRYRGSTGGSDLAAFLVNHFTGLPVGQSLLLVDTVIIFLAGLAFGPELALYGFLALYLSSKAIDLIQEGTGYNKAAHIISTKPQEIAAEVMNRLGRGVTALQGLGMYTGSERQVLFVIVQRTEIALIKEIVRDIDPRAFLVIGDVREVLGEGFQGLIME